MTTKIPAGLQDLTLDMIPEDSSDSEKFFALAMVGRHAYGKISASAEARHALWKKDTYESLEEALTFLCLLARGVHWGAAYPLEGEYLLKAENALRYIRAELSKKDA